MRTLRVLPVAAALSTFFVLTFSVSAFLEVVFGWPYSRFWTMMLIGYDGLSIGDFILGLIQMLLYGLYISLVFVPVYNYFSKGSEELPRLQ